ncbi:MAG: hypothetical protein KGZ63_07500 [Clostridiales bacterium]|jgi:hypothetical protein|nr:hypothetical protein [Clostridiales bacterium]
MATIVLHKETGKQFVLIGTGYGAFKASRPSFFGGNLFPHDEEGQMPLAAVCDKAGTIYWIYTEELKVIEIDGERIEDIHGLE